MKKIVVAAAILFCFAAPASAQWATVDVAAIAQLKAQLDEIKKSYRQMEKEYDAFNGSRGVTSLIQRPELRKYLPQEWQGVYDAVKRGQRGGVYDSINSARDRNAILTAEKVAGLATATADTLARQRNRAAIAQGTAEDSYRRAAERIDYLQSLTNSVEETKDPKAVMDLQASIAVEQAQLQNENIRLQLAHQLQLAEQQAALQKEREELIQMTGPSRVRIR